MTEYNYPDVNVNCQVFIDSPEKMLPTAGTEFSSFKDDKVDVGADKTGSTSDCVNGVFCGGKNFGEPCSGRGLCNYADGTCQCHSGYAGNACQEVEEMA